MKWFSASLILFSSSVSIVVSLPDAEGLLADFDLDLGRPLFSITVYKVWNVLDKLYELKWRPTRYHSYDSESKVRPCSAFLVCVLVYSGRPTGIPLFFSPISQMNCLVCDSTQ